MRQPIYAVLVMMLLVACRTPKATEEMVTVDTASTDTQATTSIFNSVQFNQKDWQLTDSSITEVAVTWWSTPDSLGHQYRKQTASIMRRRQVSQGHRARDSLQKTAVVSAHEQHATTANKQSEVKEQPIPKRINWFNWLIAGVVVIAIFKILKTK